MSAGEKNLGDKKYTLDKVELDWCSVGKPFVKTEGITLFDARIKLAK
jgi:hypothetical protein